jgi:glycosyltransferase involved in cell wall biosynthesis
VRILYSFPRIVGRPGVGTTAYHQIKGLIDGGHELLVYAKELEVPIDGVHSLHATVPGRRTSGIRFLAKGRERDWHDARVALEIWRLRKSIDAVYTWPGASTRTLLAARHAGIPSFLEIANTHIEHQHSVLTKEAEMLGLSLGDRYRDVLSPEMRTHYRREYRLASCLLVPSDFARQTFIQYGHPEDRLLLHRYGYDPTRFRPPTIESVAVHNQKPTILFLGRCELRKGLHHALRAWRNVGGTTRSTFVIAGSFDEGYAAYLGDWLTDPSVRTIPFCADPGRLMRNAEIFIVPSLEEGSALVSYEAQASGCAVLASDACGARLGPMGASYVHAAGDIDTLAAHLDTLLGEPAMVARLRSEALAQRPNLTWDAAAQDLSQTIVGYGVRPLRH